MLSAVISTLSELYSKIPEIKCKSTCCNHVYVQALYRCVSGRRPAAAQPVIQRAEDFDRATTI